MKTIGAPISIEKILAGSCWQLFASINGFADSKTDELATQVLKGRSFQVIDDLCKDSFQANEFCRFKVRLLEDGYYCWICLSEVLGQAIMRGPWQPTLLNKDQIQTKLPHVLQWLENAAEQDNKYLWGGTIGPDFDCSGLVQTSFASQHIWLPRDAYQQERFCEVIDVGLDNFQILRPGDLLFFGTPQKCTHVAIYMGAGTFCHSSGIINGHNGIGFDRLQEFENNSIAAHYLSQFRGAGRVVSCHDGMTLP